MTLLVDRWLLFTAFLNFLLLFLFFFYVCYFSSVFDEN